MLNFTRRYLERTEPQYVSTDNIEVKVLFSSENPSLLGKTVQTTTVELSPRSLRLELPYPVEIDSVLDIVVRVKGIEKNYYLTGNVRYRLPSRDHHYQVVLVLRERTDMPSDLRAWKNNFMQNFDFARAG